MTPLTPVYQSSLCPLLNKNNTLMIQKIGIYTITIATITDRQTYTRSLKLKFKPFKGRSRKNVSLDLTASFSAVLFAKWNWLVMGK